MAASKSSRARQRRALPALEIYAPRVMHVPARFGGGMVKEYAEIDCATGKLRRYSVVYINPAIYARDNGRVIGYDNAHGYPHRHYMGKVTREPELQWNEIQEKFWRNWHQIVSQYLEESW